MEILITEYLGEYLKSTYIYAKSKSKSNYSQTIYTPGNFLAVSTSVPKPPVHSNVDEPRISQHERPRDLEYVPQIEELGLQAADDFEKKPTEKFKTQDSSVNIQDHTEVLNTEEQISLTGCLNSKRGKSIVNE